MIPITHNMIISKKGEHYKKTVFGMALYETVFQIVCYSSIIINPRNTEAFCAH